MHDGSLIDVPDDAYRAHWLAFHEHVDWAAHKDVTAIPITFDGPDALYRRNKGSFMDRLQPAVHCRPYAAHERRARSSGAWLTGQKIFETALAPAIDCMPAPRNRVAELREAFRRYFAFGERTHGATASSSRFASTP